MSGRLAAGVVVFLVLSACGSQQSAATGRLPTQQLQDLISSVASRADGSPGVLAYVADRKSVWQGAAGFSDATKREPASPTSFYRIASSTKTFTAVVVLQLVAEGRLKLDDPVSNYLPGLLPYPEPVTIRELLNHTAGLFDWGHAEGNPSQIDDIPKISDPLLKQQAEQLLAQYQAGVQVLARPELIVAAAITHPLTFAPGAGWAYSNTNYVVLTLLVEKVTGRPLAQVYQERILQPLHLTHTSLPPDRTMPEPFMHSYTPEGGGLKDTSDDIDLGHWGDGGIVSTAGDIATFYRALMRGELVSPTLMLDMMQTVPNSPISDIGIGYGLGIYKMRSPCGLEAWGHGGDLGGYKTEAMASRDGTLVAILVQTVATSSTEAIRNQLTPQMLCLAAGAS